jgi:hypothetical protein
MWKVKQESHDLVGEVVVTVGEEEQFGAGLSEACHDSGEARISLYKFFHVFDCPRFQITLRANIFI